MSRANTLVEILTRENKCAFLMCSSTTKCSVGCSVLLYVGSESDLMLLLDMFFCSSV